MIVLLLLAVGAGLIVIPGLVMPPLRLSPAEWTRTVATSLVVGFVAIEVSLALLALPAVLGVVDASGLATVCDWSVLRFTPLSDVVGWIAAVLAGGLAWRAWHGARRGHRLACAAAVEPWLGRHENRGIYELVVLPTERLLAMSVPGSQPQVLISDGLVAHLEPDELDAVLRHEEMHHRLAHWRYTTVAVALEHVFRPVRLTERSTRALRAAVEAWADDAAAGASYERRELVRRSLDAVGCGVSGLAGSWPGKLARDRVRRLDVRVRGSRIGGRMGYIAPVAVLAVSVLVLMVTWTAGAHHAVALPGSC